MDDCKACATPFHSSVKLTKDCESSNVDVNFYCQLVSSLIYLTHSRPEIFFDVSVVDTERGGESVLSCSLLLFNLQNKLLVVSHLYHHIQ